LPLIRQRSIPFPHKERRHGRSHPDPVRTILQPLAAELAWTKNTLILDRCQHAQEREFYLRATARFGWTRRVLDHQIENKSFEKYLLNQTRFDAALPKAVTSRGGRNKSRPNRKDEPFTLKP
jgi:hypothetical protein